MEAEIFFFFFWSESFLHLDSVGQKTLCSCQPSGMINDSCLEGKMPSHAPHASPSIGGMGKYFTNPLA